MVDGINNAPNSGISSVPKQRTTVETIEESSSSSSSSVSKGSSAASAKTSAPKDAAVVVDVSEKNRSTSEVEAKVAEVNREAAGSQAPTTQELISANNSDRVAAALGNAVDIKV